MAREYTKLDPIQIQRKSYDESSEASRVKMVDTEIAIAVSAEEGDSVLAVPLSQTLSQGEYNIAGMKTLCKYGELVVKVSPLDEGDEWYDLLCNHLEPRAICARRVKLEGAGHAVVQSV